MSPGLLDACKPLAIGAVMLFGCREARSAPVAQPRIDELHVLSVCVEGSGRGSAGWPAARWPGALLSAADEKGYVATVEVGRVTRECDHCAGPPVEVRTVHGSPPPEIPGTPPGIGCLVAVGPVSEPLVHLSAVHNEEQRRSVSPEWSAAVDVDIDGNGSTDLQSVERCEGVAPSGCGDNVCSRKCRGVRTAGTSEVRFEECESFAADVGDCVP